MHAFDRQTDRRTDGETDRQTDRILIARPRLHCMQRGKKPAGKAICFKVVRPLGRPLSVNICFEWYDISVLSRRISTAQIFTMWVGIAERIFKVRGHRSRSNHCRPNAVMAEAGISSVWWGRGSLVLLSFKVSCQFPPEPCAPAYILSKIKLMTMMMIMMMMMIVMTTTTMTSESNKWNEKCKVQSVISGGIPSVNQAPPARTRRRTRTLMMLSE